MNLKKWIPQSIVSKLIFLNGLILVAFGGAIFVNWSLAKQTENLAITLVDNGISRFIKNERLSRDLYQLSLTVQLFINTFTLEQHDLESGITKLSSTLQNTVAAFGDHPAYGPHIREYAKAFNHLMAHCKTADAILGQVGFIKAQLEQSFSRIEAKVTDLIIQNKLQSKDYVISSLEQISVLLPDLKYQLLLIEKRLQDAERSHLKSEYALTPHEKQIEALIIDLNVPLAAITAAGRDFERLGNETLDQVEELRTQYRLLHQAMNTVQESLGALYARQSAVMDYMAAMETEIKQQTGLMREAVIYRIGAYGRIIGILSLLVVGVTVGVALYGIRITRPIRKLTRLTALIASGDLDREIKVNGVDEVAVLAEHFTRMRDAVRQKVTDFAENNEALTAQIQKRRQTETELSQSEEKYRTLLENLPQKIFFKDRQSVFISCNENFARDLNITADQIAGKTDYDFFPEDLAGKYIADDLRLMESGCSEEIEERYLLDGREITVNTVKTPIKDARGNAIGILGIFWDISEKKRVENELKKFERIVATSRDLMSIVDTNYIYQAVNEAYLITYRKTKEELVGRSVADLLGENLFRQKIKPFLDKSLSGREVNYQEWLSLPNIGERCMDVTFYPFSNEQGVVSGVVVNARDITQTRILEERLNQAHKMEAIGTLAGGIAHDFNNILGAIIGYAELLLMEIEESSEHGQYLGELYTAADRAKQLVNQILAFSRQSEQTIRPLKLRPIVEEAVKMLRASIPSTVEINTLFGQSIGTVMADATQIHQVVVNLCTNAAHAMWDTGGTLSISLEDTTLDAGFRRKHPQLKGDFFARLTIQDTGHGIDEALLPRIFEPYYTTKEKGVGTGLGLATVHGIIQSYDGAIDVHSKSGSGTVFTVILPKTAGPEDMEAAAGKAIEVKGGQGKVLLVDDETSLLLVGAKMLARLGYEVTTFKSSVEALARFEKEPMAFDVVVTDQTMPKMTGLELSRKLMDIRGDIPVVLCTGFSELVNESKARELGVRRFLLKPISMENLDEALRNVLGIRG